MSQKEDCTACRLSGFATASIISIYCLYERSLIKPTKEPFVPLERTFENFFKPKPLTVLQAARQKHLLLGISVLFAGAGVMRLVV